MRLLAPLACISLLVEPAHQLERPPEPGSCTTSHVQQERNKQLVIDFFSSNAPLPERGTRFLTEDYVQHNPRLQRIAALIHKKGRDAWSYGLEEAARRHVQILDLPGRWVPRPVILMAECDLVTAMYKGTVPDPDAPDRTYEAFAFEIFRVRDGKLAEHWDQIQLSHGWMNPPPGK